MIKKVSEIKARHKGYFFSPETMRFFKSKIYPTVYGGKYFVTSEQSPHGPRKFSVREWNEATDNIRTIGDFQGFLFLEDARDFAKTMAKSDMPISSNPKRKPKLSKAARKRACRRVMLGVMSEYKVGKLRAGRGKGFKVKKRKQAILIGMKKQRDMGCPIEMYAANPERRDPFEDMEEIDPWMWDDENESWPKYIKRLRDLVLERWYKTHPNITPDIDDIAGDMVYVIEENSGVEVDDAGYRRIIEIISGGR